MRFNIKLVEYQSNTATIAIFDDLVGFDDDYERGCSCDTTGVLSHDINPFTGEDASELETIENEIEAFDRQQKSIESSVNRSKRNVLHLMRSLDLSCSYFITLTFDQAKVDRKDFDLCCKKGRVWLQNLRRYKNAEDMSFICVPELHKDMVSWHLHAVICNPGEMPMADSGHKDRNGHTIYNLPGWRYGFSTAIKLDGTNPMTSIKLSKYMTKYFTKESQMILRNRHRYFSSNNIEKPHVSKWMYESREELEIILSQIKKKGYAFVSESSFDGYVKANYIEAIKTSSQKP
ncbi:MAG: hypothetical protein K6E63_10545 [Lachnospiraceae bacterium]|nr:hypothetical protein [Lachnospiraceae bacterium]